MLEDIEMSDYEIDHDGQSSNEDFTSPDHSGEEESDSEIDGPVALAGAADSAGIESDPEYIPSDDSSVTASDTDMEEAGDLANEYLGLPGAISTWSHEDRRFFVKYNLQSILGNLNRDQRFENPGSLPAPLLNFILNKLPTHAHNAVTKYFTLAVPKIMNERLAEMLISLSPNVQKELAIFITEISNLAAVAGSNTVIHLGNIFERSQLLVQWLSNLKPEVIQAVVNIPFGGHQLLAMITSSYVVVRDHTVEDTNKQQTEAGQKSRELELPLDLPTQVKHFLNWLDESCCLDLIDFVIALPENLREGFAAILGQAPPNVLRVIVNLFDTLGCYDLEAEQIDDPDAENITFDIYATLGRIDPEALLIRFLLLLPDDLFAPFWQVARAGYHLCQHIFNSELLVDFGSGQVEPTPETIVHNETYRLDVDLDEQSYSIDEVKTLIQSLRSVPLTELDEDRRECAICLNAYSEDSLDRDGCETAKQLKCGHVFGSKCLLKLLAPKLLGGVKYDTCPVCRASIWDILKVNAA
ncbi:MAG: hypothetical protein Q9195_005047 [Heterodermia aff. obscurata]